MQPGAVKRRQIARVAVTPRARAHERRRARRGLAIACGLLGAVCTACGGGGGDDEGAGAAHGAPRSLPGVAPKPERVTTLPAPRSERPEQAEGAEPRPRPPEDVQRDADRKPQEVMDFLGIEPGMRVAELMSGRGYYAELLSRRVGDRGRVFAHNSPFVMDRFAREPIEERLENPALEDVELLETPVDHPGLPPRLDAVVIILFFHDLYWQEVDRERALHAVWRSLTPGGIFGVVDHVAAEGAGTRDVKSLHRVEPSVVRAEIEAAGFEFVDSSPLLANPDDEHTLSAFDEAIRGKTDRFIHRYRKVNK